MRIGSLFSGYGGLDLGVQAVLGGTVAWHCEFDQAPSKVLAHHWPDAPNLGDITAVDWAEVEPVDVLTGGFPCQDLSTAGKRLGLRPGTRSGLWEHMAYAIDQLRPRMVVIENVRGLLSAEAHCDLERDCWCVGDEREPALRALGAVLGDLAGLGYDARWGGVRAADAGAPHGRFRVFIVAQPADTDLAGLEGRPADRRGAGERPTGAGGVGAGPGSGGDESPGRAGMTLLPTPKASDGPNGGPGMRNGRGEADALPGVVSLLPTPASQAAKHGGTPDVNANGYGSNLWDLPHLLEGITDGDATEAGPDQALPPHRPGPDAQRPSEPDDAVRVVPPSAALAGGPGAADGSRAPGTGDISGTWGPYAPAVLRWEMVTGRVAPAPTEAGKDGRPRLSPRAVEWLMGLPAGHVTDPAIGLTRAQALRGLGNGVVPQQAALALRMLLGLGGTAAEPAPTLLPTPVVNDMGEGKQPADWDAWTERMKSAHGNGNGHGPSLAIEALRLGGAS